MSKYIKVFETHIGYEEYINGEGAVLPNVSFCEDARDVHYNPWVYDPSQDYFTMVVTSGGNVTWAGTQDYSVNKLSYSTDNGITWSTPNRIITLTVNEGDKVLWKGTTNPAQNRGIGMFSGDTDVRYSVEGNVMSLLFGDDFKGQTSLTNKNDALCYLFHNNKNITSAENLSLPATTLASACYYYMFNGCTSLTTAPELPATTLAGHCYYSMFKGCTSLTTAPELPATTLANWCYGNMFQGCTSLTTAPELPATTLTSACYDGMFSDTNVLPDCTNIDFSSQSVVTSGGLKGLFEGTKITDAQLDTILKEHGINNYSLPVTTLASDCYSSMFASCTNLTTAPELPATELADDCYHSMFYGCTSLTTAPELPATELVDCCYEDMFAGCTSLNSIKCLATDISASDCTYEWVEGVAASGTFTKAASMSGWTTGNDGIPSGWTVQDA